MGHFIKATSFLNNLQGNIASPGEMMSSSTAVEQLMYNYNEYMGAPGHSYKYFGGQQNNL